MGPAIQRQATFLAMLLGLIVLAGCASGGSGKAPAPTATLIANPTTFTAGQGYSTLTYTSTNADAGVIDAIGDVGTNGSHYVSPTVTTTYTYTASGPGGSASAQATVTVTPAPPAPTVSLTVTPAAIFPGQSITLTWKSTNATSVVIDNNIGAVQPVSAGSVSLPQSMLPTQTTTYTAVATGNNQQATATATVTVSPIISFDGMLPDSSNNTDTKIDPNGAVGTKQFMEYVNTEYQAFDKITHQPVLPPTSQGMSGQAIGTPWTTAFPNCAGTGIALDAVINFDRLASRWVIAGKAVRQNGSSNDYYFCIAVSNTGDASDPNFGWYAYGFHLNHILETGPLTNQYYFPDWPKLGTWPDAYYATMDMLDPNGNNTENGVAVCAFDRNNMLSGATMNPPQCFTDTSRMSNGVYLAHSLIPADFDGTTAPPAGRDEFLVSIENPLNDGTTTTSTSFNLWDFHVDWSNYANTTLTVTPISVAPYTPGCYLYVSGSPAITNCVNEPSSGGQGQHIDSVGDRFMPRFAYRNFGSYESFLVSHTVKTAADINNNPNQTGINWYELRWTGGTPPLSLFQSGTINPDNSLFRFLPSIAQDKDANVAVGYNVSNSFTDPGIDFSYWNLANATAPIEISILSGTGEEVTPTTGTGNWGTYSSMTVDPNPTDDCTFWYVNEYWTTSATSAAWATRIAYFKIPTCVP